MKAEIGKRLRRLRTEKKFTQKELAARISGGIDYTYIGKIERGEQLPSLKILLKISETLAVPVDSFFRDEAAVMLADARLQRLSRGRRGTDLLTALQTLHEDDVPLLVEIIRALTTHRNRGEDAKATPIAAEENAPYGTN